MLVRNMKSGEKKVITTTFQKLKEEMERLQILIA